VPLRPLHLTVLCAVTFAGCGAADQAKSPKVEACPSGTAELGVKDVLPDPPAGTEIVAPDRKSTKPVEDAFRKAAGDSLRSVRSRVVVKSGRAVGTLVIVLNANERINPRDVLLGARDSADEAGAEPKELTIAGEDGVIVVSADGAAAAGTVGECSGVTLFGPTEAEVRAVAGRVRAGES
jgi:hypothetical protein